MLDATYDLIYLQPHDLPEKFRPDLEELMAFFDREDGPEGSIIASIRKMTDDEVVRAFALICMLAVAVDAIQFDPRDLH